MALCGFLAPDGTFTECDSWEHTSTAQEIAEKCNQSFLNGIQAENFLFDAGYVGFYSRDASHRFIVGKGKERKILLLTDKQKDFIISNLINANNDEQKKAMQEILEHDDGYREYSILHHYGN